MRNRGYYLAGVLFFLLGVYQVFHALYMEAAMYISLSIGFHITGVIKNKLYLRHHKTLGIVSWALIFIALFIFLFLLRTDPK